MNYLESLAAEIRRRVPEDRVPEGDTRQLFMTYAVLARAKGEAVTAEDVHDAWTAWMTLHEGDHASLVAFERLDKATKAEDNIFVQAIREAALHSSPED